MSIWADLAGDDSNLSMAADEFVDIKNSNILSDISNSASQNRSRYDPELDNSKQGLNLQLNQFGLGNNSNSGLGKKRLRCELQGNGDTDMPPKSKQRTKGPQDFSHFLGSSSAASSLNLSGASSCPTNLTNASSTTSIPTPTKTLNQTSDGLYAAIIGKGKSTKQSPEKTTQSPVPALVSQSSSTATTSKTSANPTPTSASSVKKITSSVPSSVRRRRLMRRRMGKRKSAASSQSPTKDTDTITQEREQDDDVLMEPATVQLAPSEPVKDNAAPQPMEEDDKTDVSNGFEQEHTVLSTWGNGKIFLPSDIVESAKKASSLPRPSPFRLARSTSQTSTSTSPQKLSFAAAGSEEPEPQQPVFIPTTTMSTVPFNLTNFMPLPIPSLPLSSTSVSSAATPNNENALESTPGIAPGIVNPMVSPQPMLFQFAPLAHPGVVSPHIIAPTATSPFDTTALASVPMPFAFPMAFGNIPCAPNGAPTFIPFQPPTPTPPIDSPTEPSAEMSIENAPSEEIAVPENSVWAGPGDEPAEENSWRNKCFKSEVARNKALKVSEDATRIAQRKQDLRMKQREKELLPLEQKVEVSYNSAYGTEKQPKSWRRGYHPYDQSDVAGQCKPKRFVDRRARGRARTRSMSNSTVSSPDKLVWRKADSASASDTTSRERSGSISTDTTGHTHQDPKPLTEERIAWRMNQIEIAKNTDGYRNYIQSLPKAQRKKQHPQTPNPKEKIAKRRWAGKYNKWRKLLHQFDLEGGEGVEAIPETAPPPPSSVCDANECPIALASVDDDECALESHESMDVDNQGSDGHDVKQHDAIDA